MSLPDRQGGMVGTVAAAAGRAKPKDPFLTYPSRLSPCALAFGCGTWASGEGASEDGHGIWSVRPLSVVV